MRAKVRALLIACPTEDVEPLMHIYNTASVVLANVSPKLDFSIKPVDKAHIGRVAPTLNSFLQVPQLDGSTICYYIMAFELGNTQATITLAMTGVIQACDPSRVDDIKVSLSAPKPPPMGFTPLSVTPTTGRSDERLLTVSIVIRSGKSAPYLIDKNYILLRTSGCPAIINGSFGTVQTARTAMTGTLLPPATDEDDRRERSKNTSVLTSLKGMVSGYASWMFDKERPDDMQTEEDAVDLETGGRTSRKRRRDNGEDDPAGDAEHTYIT